MPARLSRRSLLLQNAEHQCHVRFRHHEERTIGLYSLSGSLTRAIHGDLCEKFVTIDCGDQASSGKEVVTLLSSEVYTFIVRLYQYFLLLIVLFVCEGERALPPWVLASDLLFHPSFSTK